MAGLICSLLTMLFGFVAAGLVIDCGFGFGLLFWVVIDYCDFAVMVAYLFGFASGDLFACLLLPVGLVLDVVCWLVWMVVIVIGWLIVLLWGCWFVGCSGCLFILCSWSFLIVLVYVFL